MKSPRQIRVGTVLFIAFFAITWLLSNNGLQAQTPDPLSPQEQVDVLDKIEPLVLTQIESSGQTEFFIWMTEKADLSPAYNLETKEEKGQFVFETLRETAARSQAELRKQFDSNGTEYRPFYISNKILVFNGTQTMVMDIATRADVARITANHTYQLQEPAKSSKGGSPQAIETNITFINADDVWGLGYTGSGILLAGNDTGLDETHPTILPHYRGCQNPPTCSTIDHNYNWWDATNTYPLDPDDGHGHGTHTTGTMVGDDGGANQIGVAPGAQTVHCKNMTDTGNGTDLTFSTCFEWDLAPWDLSGANPRPDLAPDAINNSWGYNGGGQTQFRDEIAALQAAGILVELSAGNSGPSCSSLGSPGDYQEVLTTGSINHASGSMPGTITGSSSRGPSSLDGNYFPDVMAPGENIRSALPGNSYGSWGGTSMSGPHVTALVGLMWSASPALRGDIDTTVDIIRNTAVPLTGQNGSSCGGDYTTGPNNDWGFGTIDALAAVQEAILYSDEVGTLSGIVTDSSNSNPIEAALIEATLSPTQTWSIATNITGVYTTTLISGTYDVEASAFGYLPASVSNIDIISGTNTIQDFALTPAPNYTVDGYVTDANTGWPLYASLDIDGYPGDPIWTDPISGYYSISLPAGITYTFNVAAWVTGYEGVSIDVGPLASSITQDFLLDADAVACTAPGYELEDGISESFNDTVLPDGWTIVNGGGTCDWTFDDPGGRTNLTGGTGNFAIADSDACGSGTTMTTTLYSPIADVSSLASVLLEFKYDYNNLSAAEIAEVDISADGGSNWTNIVSWNTDQRGVATFTQDVTAQLGGSTQAQVRFHYVAPGWYWWWQVDDVVLGSPTCIPPTDGGLLVGNVYDENTSDALNGAEVASDGGLTVSAVATPLDDNVDDAFFSIFSPSSSHTFTATMSGGYGADVETVAIANGDTVAQSFNLPAGWITATPNALEVTVLQGDSMTVPLDINNVGALSTTFALSEKTGGFAPTLLGGQSYPHMSVPYWDKTETAPDGSLNRLLAWGTGADIPTGERYRAAGTSCDGQSYYVMGGGSSGPILNEAWNYDPGSDTWTQLADLPVALMNFEAACLDGFIYLVGGYDGIAHTNNFQIYDIADDSWTATTWVNASSPMTAVYNGLLYTFGGNPGPSAETWVYDPDAATWTQLANMPTANSYGAAITVGDYIYQIGGGSANTVQRYDPTNNTWDNSGPQLQDSRMSALSVWYGDYIYVASGGGVGGDVWSAWSTTEVYDPSLWPSGAWVYDDENVGTPVVAPAGDCASDSIWGAGGTSNSTNYATNQSLDDGMTCNIYNSSNDIPWLSEDPITGTINANSLVTIDVTFDTMTYTLGTYTGTLKVKSDAPVNGTINIPVTMNVVDVIYGVEISPTTAVATDTPGSTVSYTLLVTNTGTTTDTIALVPSGQSWTTAVSPPTVTLAAGASATTTVTVTIPTGTADGDNDVVAVTATSQGDNTKTAVATFTTTAELMYLYLPIIMKP